MIGDFIERVVDAGTVSHRDIAVLYRMNSQSLPLQLELLTRGIPYYCRKDDNILGHEQLPRVVAALRFVAAVRAREQPALADFMQTVRAYFQYLRDEDADRVARRARRGGPPFIDCLGDERLATTKIGKSNVEDAIRELIATESPLDTLVFLGERFRGVRGMVGSLEEAAGDQLPLGELGDVAMRFATLGEFTEFLEMAIRRARTGHTEDYEADSVRLLTYFRSKGAQFETVILPSLNEGVIPHGRSPLEDERRLFYVAVTRTKRNLWLSYVKRICNKAVDISRFLKELELPRSSWV
jgi:DNA helicase-2/ATP-dependent DNA helicase PcrA